MKATFTAENEIDASEPLYVILESNGVEYKYEVYPAADGMSFTVEVTPTATATYTLTYCEYTPDLNW